MQHQPLTPFYPIFPVKSDGHDVVNQKGRVVRNGPTQEQLDRTPNEQGQCDFYRLIEKDDPKHTDWRKKLGGMLLREIGAKEHEGKNLRRETVQVQSEDDDMDSTNADCSDKWQQCILWDFPENYKLYEHIKTKADGQAKLVKNHSGGGHDRQDAYLYGYPKGPRKRYRSPADFFPHLLWLCTDETSDYQNCTCKMCSPVQLDAEKPAVAPPAVTAPSATLPPQHTVVGRNPVVQIPARRPSTAAPVQLPSAVKPPTPAPAPSAPQIRPPTTLQSTPLPQPRSAEQQVDHQYNKFLCRTGEVVWFYRPKTSAWGLGLVVRRWAVKDDKSYLVQPLSHPFDSPAQELVTSDQHLKPWLAWSAPSGTFAYLQQNPNLTYAQVDWRALLSGQFGQGIADVDASIMAAKAIDSTYTLAERLKTTSTNGMEERHYNAIYLGAEKIWRGEAVRLRIGSGTDLMVIADIIERLVPGLLGKQPSSQVYVLGDIYSFSTLPAPDPNNPPDPPQQNANIPSRMREDMAWRNRALIPMSRTAAYWRLISPLARLPIEEIKGRWYETSIVFQDSFTKAIKNNEGGNGIWMNSRGDATGVGKSRGVAKSDRVGAFGASVPKGCRLVEGLEGVVEQRQSQSQSAQGEMQGLEYAPAGGQESFDLDDFMHVESLEDGGMDFGQGFAF
ncbi:hypothetical protein P153DRAFT_385884 [Dothidotthia symphoricarpi CBS 119687]|uniref:Cryptic loci regulator 2 N-terminal domain-containing protein n=1 Tax=Dothidotthia symphoricarpi CBS 119687 TaxID=1392245 RepID=A0A6A6ACP2_9PLEO|nr:uncharacterized protein P153DRAFT_385884 [Dothidotthia symphoricarpi CBS 119687]KAF2129672.1 hypothetical protein P153DRAFT_385884 [Dothidotthia symphoricarpi CBS 119687]